MLCTQDNPLVYKRLPFFRPKDDEHFPAGGFIPPALAYIQRMLNGVSTAYLRIIYGHQTGDHALPTPVLSPHLGVRGVAARADLARFHRPDDGAALLRDMAAVGVLALA